MPEITWHKLNLLEAIAESAKHVVEVHKRGMAYYDNPKDWERDMVASLVDLAGLTHRKELEGA